jgi:periplasmic copper chaperone A
VKHIILAALLAPAFAHVCAQVVVTDAWVRTTIPQQKATGAFMQLTAAHGTRLVDVSSPVAGLAELHEMSVDRDVMRMRPVAGIDLPAGTTVALKPGGYHVMLMDLRRPLGNGQRVPVTLVFESPDKRRSSIEIDAVARP